MTKYNTLYPGATQVLVLSRQSATWASQQNNLDAVRPAIDVLKDAGILGSLPPNVLVHVFSNGGARQLTFLSDLLHKIPQPPVSQATPPAECLILDSVPGNAGLATSLRAFTAPIKFLPLKWLAAVPLTILWCAMVGVSKLTGKPDIIEVLRQRLNDPNILPWSSAKTPRVYIYSKDDQVVPSYAVEEHIATARSQKLTVTAELFLRSAHVAHARADPDRYWSIVTNTWADALKSQAAGTVSDEQSGRS
ncbi:hypothetical protein EUX98_g3471 [Antrodiella citrinella]|uniref:DUF829 domain-containing protein n=1 Tax=Antrodiella citrinella TaxID=2447956 RepID=A0A4S4N4K9_9APHY|nr:hypothetical protein EUX98_g3471 [Antrodiella citrinella]